MKINKISIVLLMVSVIIVTNPVMAQDLSFESPTLLQIADNGGFIEQDNEGMRAIDFQFNTTTISNKSQLESRLIIGNYGTTKESFDIKTEITRVETLDGTSVSTDKSNFLNYPVSNPYTTEIEAGINKVYEFTYEFEETGVYVIDIYKSSNKPTKMPVVSQKITVLKQEANTGKGSFEDRTNLTQKFNTVQEFKDTNSEVSSLPLSNINLPPVETVSGGEVKNLDVAKGSVKSFNNIRRNTTSVSGLVENEGGDVMTGFQFEDVENRDHLGLRIKYDLENSPNIDELNIDIVDSIGRQIDDNTTYKLNNRVSGIKTIDIHLSEKEYNFIKKQGKSYVLFNGTDPDNDGVRLNGDIRIYEMGIISSNKIFGLADDNLEVDGSISVTNDPVDVGERITLSADIINRGTKSVNRKFNLYESDSGDVIRTLERSDKKIINPGESKTVNIPVTVGPTMSSEFMILGTTKTITVNNNRGLKVERPDLVTSDKVIGVGQSLDVTITDFSRSLSDINKIEWYITSKASPDITESSPSDLKVPASFSSDGSKSITAEIEYKDSDGNNVETSVSTEVDVLSKPIPNLVNGYYQLDVESRNQRGSSSQGSSLDGVIRSGSCDYTCSGVLEINSKDLPVSSGINMLVLSTDWENKKYDIVHYGAYQVNKGSSGTYSTADNIRDAGVKKVKTGLSGSGGNPSQELANDISSFLSDSRDYHFVMMSGGDPKPEVSSSALYKQLQNLGVNIGKNCNMGSTSKCKFDNNAQWTYIGQSKSSGSVVPLKETYKMPDSGSDGTVYNFDLEPVSMGSSIPPDRTVYHDIRSTKTVGTLSTTNSIDWDIPSSSSPIYTTGNEIVSNEYDPESFNIVVEIEDELNNVGQTTVPVQIGTEKPNVYISADELVATKKGTVSALGSFDTDSSIIEYDWDIEDPDGKIIEYKGYKFNRTWKKSGKYDIELQVTDNYGSTNTTSKTIEVKSGPPQVNTDIRRITGEYSSFEYNKYRISESPTVHYTFNSVSDGVNDIVGTTIAEKGPNVISDTGVSKKSAVVTGGKNGNVSIKHDSSLNINSSTISTWVNIPDVEKKSVIAEKENEYRLSINNGKMIFVDLDGSAYSTNDKIGLKDSEWKHIAVTIDHYKNRISFYVNGSEEYNVNSGISSLSVGNTKNNLTVGPSISPPEINIDDFRIYNKPLTPEEINSIYQDEADFEYTGPIQNVLYSNGDEIIDISKNDVEGGGSINKNSDSIILTADATSGSDSSKYIQTDPIDTSKYDEIYMTYNREFERSKLTGERETGYVAMHVLDPTKEYGSPGVNRADGIQGVNADSEEDYVQDEYTGVMKLDVSPYTSSKSLKVYTKAHGSNEGLSKVTVKEIWAVNRNDNLGNSSKLFESGLYPSDTDNVKYYKTRNGIGVETTTPAKSRLISNMYGSGTIQSKYNIENVKYSGTGHNIYAEKSGSYDVTNSLQTPAETLSCSTGSPVTVISCTDPTNQNGNRIIQSSPTDYKESGIISRTGSGNYIEYKELRFAGQNINKNYQRVMFDSTDSKTNSKDETINKFQWDIEPAASFTVDKRGPIMTHNFSSTGKKEVKLKIIDSKGGQVTRTYTVEVENLDPEVDAVLDDTVQVGEKLSVNLNINNRGKASFEEAKIMFGNGDTKKTTDPNGIVNYKYTKSGEYNITIVGVDSAGQTGVHRENISVKPNLPDTSGLSDEIKAHINDTILLDATGSAVSSNPLVTTKYDASSVVDSYKGGGSLDFKWTLPDGKEVNDKTTRYIETDLISDASPETITLEIENPAGVTVTKDIEISTYNDGPQVGLVVDGNPAPVNDPNADVSVYPDQDVTVQVSAYHPHSRVSGGEAKTSIGSRDITESYDTSTSNTYTYKESFSPATLPAKKDIKVEVTDEYGKTVSSNTKKVEIRHSGVKVTGITSSNGTTVSKDESLTFTANVDAKSTDSSDLEHTFSFSDGTTSSPQNSNTYTHSFSSAGSKTLTVDAEDTKYGYTGSRTLNLNVVSRESCLDIQNMNPSAKSGSYNLKPTSSTTINAYCDMTYNGGGWTVLDVSTLKDYYDNVGGSYNQIDGANGFGFNGDKPYSYDLFRRGDEEHFVHYNIDTGFEFDEMAVESLTFSDQSFRNGDSTSETHHTGSYMGSWANNANAGNIVWGTAESSVAVDGYENGDSIHCSSCTNTWDPSKGSPVYYNLGKTSDTIRFGWGESGYQEEGWTFESGKVYVR